MKALILAAGYATRLYPLTKGYPKALLKVGKRPIVDYIIDKLQNLQRLDEIIVVTNSKFIAQFRKWKLKIKSKKHISLVDDLTKTYKSRRGAIGDMAFAINKRRINEDLLVVGADNLFDGDLKDFLGFAKGRKPYVVIGAYNIREKEKASKYGVLKLGAKNRIIDFKEKPQKPNSTLVAMCLYYFPKEKLEIIQEYITLRNSKHDATGFYIDWLRKKEAVYGYIFKKRWYDIGDYNFYNQARKEKF